MYGLGIVESGPGACAMQIFLQIVAAIRFHHEQMHGVNRAVDLLRYPDFRSGDCATVGSRDPSAPRIFLLQKRKFCAQNGRLKLVESRVESRNGAYVTLLPS